jgi:ABC-type glycerol-3-phosphate transport system permease component
MAISVNQGATRRRFSFSPLLIYLLLITTSIVMMVSLIWMVLTSVKIDAEIFGLTPRRIPSQFDWSNYSDAYRAINMGLLFRQFFLRFPKEIEAAAMIDGCSHARFFWSILMPNSKPVLGTLGLFSFLWTWNDFLWPLVVVKEDRMKTLQLGLSAFNQEFGTQWAELMAASVMVTLPVILLFLYAQRSLVRGLATSGIKG